MIVDKIVYNFGVVKFRYPGRSGIQISALTFGNWLTQHSRSDVEAASRCIRAAIDAGITCFDSADSYANGVAEECLGGVTVSDPALTAEFTPAARPV